MLPLSLPSDDISFRTVCITATLRSPVSTPLLWLRGCLCTSRILSVFMYFYTILISEEISSPERSSGCRQWHPGSSAWGRGGRDLAWVLLSGATGSPAIQTHNCPITGELPNLQPPHEIIMNVVSILQLINEWKMNEWKSVNSFELCCHGCVSYTTPLAPLGLPSVGFFRDLLHPSLKPSSMRRLLSVHYRRVSHLSVHRSLSSGA